MDPLSLASRIASSGLDVQETRMRILSENLANAQSTGDTPGADAYRRKTISFSWELDRSIGASRAKVAKIDYRSGRIQPSSSTRATRPLTKRAWSSCPMSMCSSNWPTCARPTGPTKPIFKPSSKPGNWSQ
jgi:flagellar basal body rod protein FlgB